MTDEKKWKSSGEPTGNEDFAKLEAQRREIHPDVGRWDFRNFMPRVEEPEETSAMTEEDKSNSFTEAYLNLVRVLQGGQSGETSIIPAHAYAPRNELFTDEEKKGKIKVGKYTVDITAFALNMKDGQQKLNADPAMLKLQALKFALEKKVNDTFDPQPSIATEYHANATLIVDELLDEVVVPLLAYMDVETEDALYEGWVLPLEGATPRAAYQLMGDESGVVKMAGFLYQNEANKPQLLEIKVLVI